MKNISIVLTIIIIVVSTIGAGASIVEDNGTTGAGVLIIFIIATALSSLLWWGIKKEGWLTLKKKFLIITIITTAICGAMIGDAFLFYYLKPIEVNANHQNMDILDAHVRNYHHYRKPVTVVKTKKEVKETFLLGTITIVPPQIFQLSYYDGSHRNMIGEIGCFVEATNKFKIFINAMAFTIALLWVLTIFSFIKPVHTGDIEENKNLSFLDKIREINRRIIRKS